jgi:hypothetical protein
VALVHATAYSDDRQVMVFLARELEALGATAVLAGPDHIRWDGGGARFDCAWAEGRIDRILRFFPAEWLPALPSRRWKGYFRARTTPQSNPPAAIAVQSKRFPLVWDDLPFPMESWRRWMPETRDPRQVPRDDEGWVLKPALGRVGEDIGMAGVTDARILARIRRDVRRHPERWAAQRRFRAVPIDGPEGPLHPCIGIYTVDGRACGAYGRASAKPLIDGGAREAPVFLERRAGGGAGGFRP